MILLAFHVASCSQHSHHGSHAIVLHHKHNVCCLVFVRNASAASKHQQKHVRLCDPMVLGVDDLHSDLDC